ncbi:MAG: hypothetical protein ACXACG_14050 [Candidatus Thorarchaeota archaeon]|jgi:hypothetical protein
MVREDGRELRYSRPQGEIDRIGPELLGEWMLSGTERGRNSIYMKLSVNTAALLSVALQNAIPLTDTENNEITLSIRKIRTKKKKVRGKTKEVCIGNWTVTVDAKPTE